MVGELDNKDLHAQSIQEFTRAFTGWRDVYDQGIEDAYFVHGDQWPEQIRSEREEAGRPALTANKLWKFVKNVQGDQQQNRPQVKVLPSDSKSDPVTAEILQDIIRHIEYKSQADVVYDTGFNQCLVSSIGFWRIISKYEEGMTFDQCLRIELIPNQFSVLFDPKAKDPMLTDAKYCYISTWMSKDEFEHKYPKAEVASWPTEGMQDLQEGWWEHERIRVAEKYYKKMRKVKIARLSTGEVLEINSEIREAIEQTPDIYIEQERDAEIEEIWWCKMNGHEIIEGPTKQPGKYIPVVPILGDEINLEGKRTLYSLIRHAKDPQRMYNYWITTSTETVALQPKAPYLMTPEQVETFESQWRDAAKSNRTYLVYNHVEGHGKPTREQPPTIPSGAFAETDRADRQIFETIGMTAPSLGEPSNERSGKALAMRQRSADKAIYSFFDNHSRAIAHTGKILVDLIPYYYDTERIIMIQGDDQQLKKLVINQAVMDLDEMEEVIINDLKDAGDYDVILASGASYQTKRQEVLELYKSALQFAPNFAPVIIPKMISTADAPGAQELAEQLAQFMQAQIQGGAPGTPGAERTQQLPA
jgi:hypothetical protein